MSALSIIEYFTQNVNNKSQNITQTYNRGGDTLIYSNIKVLCEKQNISISKLERKLDFPKSSICKWDKNEPSIRKVQKVAKLLDVTIDSLLKDNNDA